MLRVAVWIAKALKGTRMRKVGEYKTRAEARTHGDRVFLRYREYKPK